MTLPAVFHAGPRADFVIRVFPRESRVLRKGFRSAVSRGTTFSYRSKPDNLDRGDRAAGQAIGPEERPITLASVAVELYKHS